MRILINNVDEYIGRAIVDEFIANPPVVGLTKFQTSKEIEIYGTVVNPNSIPVEAKPTEAAGKDGVAAKDGGSIGAAEAGKDGAGDAAKEEDEEEFKNIPKIPASVKVVSRNQGPQEILEAAQLSNLVVFDLHSADFDELEFILQGLKICDAKAAGGIVVILISSVMVWTGMKRPEVLIEQREIEVESSLPPPEDGEEDTREKEIKIIEKRGPEMLTDEDWPKRIPHNDFKMWTSMETLAFSLNTRDFMRGIVLTSGLLYGRGDPVFFNLLKAAWQQEKRLFRSIAGGNNYLPCVHVTDLAKCVKQISFDPDATPPLPPPEPTEDGEEPPPPPPPPPKKKEATVLPMTKTKKRHYLCVDESDMTQKDLLTSVLNEFHEKDLHQTWLFNIRNGVDGSIVPDFASAASIPHMAGGLMAAYTSGEELGPMPTVEELKKEANLLVEIPDLAASDGKAKTIADVFDPKEHFFLNMNLRMQPSESMRAILNPYCREGLTNSECLKKVSSEYCKVVNLKPIRAIFVGPPASYSAMVAAVSSEYEVPVISRHSLIAEFMNSFPEDSEDPFVVFLRERYDPQTGTWYCDEESETKDCFTPLEDQFIIVRRLLRAKLETSVCRFRGYILDGFPTTHQEAQILFSDYIEPPELEIPEDEEVPVPVPEVGHFELIPNVPDVLCFCKASESTCKHQFMESKSKWDGLNEQFIADFIAPVEELNRLKKEAEEKTANRDKEQKVIDKKRVDLEEARKKRLIEEFNALVAAANDEGTDPPTGDPLENLETNWTPEEKEEEAAINEQQEALILAEQEPPPPQPILPSTIYFKEQGQRTVDVSLDYIFAGDAMDDSRRLKTLLLNEFKNALESKVGKIFNFFPTERELREAEERRLAEEAARQAKIEEERRKKLLAEEEQEMAVKNKQEVEKLANLNEEEEKYLESLSDPLKDYMRLHVVPTISEGLIEVCRVMPDDPVDYLAEFLFARSSEMAPLPP